MERIGLVVHIVSETQCRTTVGIKGIELGQCGIEHEGTTSKNGQTIVERIADLAVGHPEVGVIGRQTIALAIMDGHILHSQTVVE